MTSVMEPLPEKFGEGGPRIWENDKIDEQIKARHERGGAIVDKGTQDMSYLEVRELKKLTDEIELLQGQKPMPHIGHPTGERSRFGGHLGGKLGGSFYEAIVKAGWDPSVGKNRVTVPADAALFSTKAVSVLGNPEEYFPRTVPETALGSDRRYVYPALRQVRVSATDASVQYLKQSSRTLATPANMIRDIDAVTEKPETI